MAGNLLAPEPFFPQWDRRNHHSISADDDTEQLSAADFAVDSVSFDKAWSVPGTEHLMHTVMQTSCSKLPNFQDWLARAKSVAKMLSSRMYR